MKIDFGETFQEKKQRLEKPHKWFAWHPVKVGPHDYRWLEFVERTGKFTDWEEDSIFLFSYKPL